MVKNRSMRIERLVILISVAFLALSCSSKYEKVMKSNDPDLQYKTAFEYYNAGKYGKAADIFENLILLMQGLPQEDTVQFYNALSNYKYSDYVTAESNFEKFITVFPRSPFNEEAQYLRITCLYKSTLRYELDPTPTQKAITVISEFMYDNPGSKYYAECDEIMKELMGRLDKKNFESAKLYYSMEDFQAAHYALKNVLRDNADNAYREDVLYFTALASYKYALNSIEEKQKERYLTFVDDYYNFIGEYPESKQRSVLDVYYSKALEYTKLIEVMEANGGKLSKQDIKQAKKDSKELLKKAKEVEKMRKEEEKNIKEVELSADKAKKAEKAERRSKNKKERNKEDKTIKSNI